MLAVILASLFSLAALAGLVTGLAIGFVRALPPLAKALAYAPAAVVRPPRAAARAVLVPV